jgi:hypothetical protein
VPSAAHRRQQGSLRPDGRICGVRSKATAGRLPTRGRCLRLTGTACRGARMSSMSPSMVSAVTSWTGRWCSAASPIPSSPCPGSCRARSSGRARRRYRGASGSPRARSGRLALLHYDQKVAITGPLRLGGPLPTEEAHPFDHPDGIGIVAGIAPLGFSVPVLMGGTPGGGMRYRWTARQFPDSGPVRERIDKHARRTSGPVLRPGRRT